MKHIHNRWMILIFTMLLAAWLTACEQGKNKADIDEKIWDDSLKAYEITSDYVLNENFQLTEEEEQFLADYLKHSNAILLDDSGKYNEVEKELVNEIVTIIHSVNIHKDTQNYRAIDMLKDNFEKLDKTFGQ